MKTEKKKSPSDYPMFAFRISASEKKHLSTLIDKAVKLSNKNLEEGDRAVRKNDITTKALELGLNQIIKKLER
ncbi:MAG TPA: hypothetical protein VNJ08_10460 [Bacteriovoracaceae bacterium]|nr:hypothetical protein [Bacteriovoracaceae bacterium]